MALHSTYMKRIVAKEFLLLVGCVAIVLLVALFGWIRNRYLNYRAETAHHAYSAENAVLDSLNGKGVPIIYDAADLFDSAYTHKAPTALIAPQWILDAAAKRKRLWDNLKRDGYDLPDFEAFTYKLAQRPRRAILHAALIKEGYDIPDFDTFSRDIAGDLLPSPSKPEFDPSKPFEVVQPDPLNILPPPPPKWNRDKVIRFVNALKDQGFLTPDRVNHYATKGQVETSDSSANWQFLITVQALMADTAPYTELRMAFNHLKERKVLSADFNVLVSTLQDKPVPPSTETLDAIAKQRTIVDGLLKMQNDARAGIWSAAKQWAVVKWAAIVLLVLVYPLRLLVLGTRWAIRTIRQ